MKSLKLRNAILTGASRGIGTRIAAALVREGVNLALVARSAQELESVAEGLKKTGGRVVAVPADITCEEGRSKLFECAERELGQIDILVNNAGIAHWIPFEHQEESEIAAVITTNLLASLFLTRKVLPGMISRGWGHIVNISSLSGKRGVPFEAAYSGSKAALIAWSRAVRMELEGTGVGVSVLSLGYISQVGGFVRQGFPCPPLAGSSSPERVAKAVVKAIRKNARDLIVWSRPARPLLALDALSPMIGDQILRLVGVVKLNRKLAEGHRHRSGRLCS